MSDSTAVIKSELQRYADLDKRLLAAGAAASPFCPRWPGPASLENRMIAAYAKGRFALPDVTYKRPDLSAARAELAAIEADAGGSDPDDIDPLGDYLRRTAESWRIAGEMLEAVGTAGVTAPSIILYGRPNDTLPGSKRSNLDAARYFVELSDELGADLLADGITTDITSEALRDELSAERWMISSAPARFESRVDPELTAKAAAGATRIRLRGETHFSEYDHHQLLAHEAFVHSLTALNGRRQPLLTSLARTSPRVTATQEGFGGVCRADVRRHRHHPAQAHQSAHSGRSTWRSTAPTSSRSTVISAIAGRARPTVFHSAQRVFRGVPLTGGSAFAKDNVYLAGLLTVHTFFRWGAERATDGSAALPVRR